MSYAELQLVRYESWVYESDEQWDLLSMFDFWMLPYIEIVTR